jgi:hypothetical protein
MRLPLPKRQGAGALQDASAKGNFPGPGHAKRDIHGGMFGALSGYKEVGPNGPCARPIVQAFFIQGFPSPFKAIQTYSRAFGKKDCLFFMGRFRSWLAETLARLRLFKGF